LINNNILTLLLDEENDDMIFSDIILTKKKNSTDDTFKNRAGEGFFGVSINRRLKNNEIRFREFFRVNHDQFEFLSSLVAKELTAQASDKARKESFTP